MTRARELGINVRAGTPGPLDAITDVAGVRVGATTLIAGDDVRTGVTVIVPADADVAEEQLFAGCHTPQRQRRADRARMGARLGPADDPDRAHQHPQCRRLAQRTSLGVARTGGAGEHSSGDIMIAFSTARQGLPPSDVAGAGEPVTVGVTMFVDSHTDALYHAAVEATEAAIVNALLAAETMTGRGGVTAYGLEPELLLEAMRRFNFA